MSEARYLCLPTGEIRTEQNKPIPDADKWKTPLGMAFYNEEEPYECSVWFEGSQFVQAQRHSAGVTMVFERNVQITIPVQNSAVADEAIELINKLAADSWIDKIAAMTASTDDAPR